MHSIALYSTDNGNFFYLFINIKYYNVGVLVLSKIGQARYVGETFPRRSSGTRHNLNLHSGVSMVVRFTDYVIGVISGKYKPPDL